MLMAVRRLEEEKVILVTEMNKHWKSLCNHADSLKERSSQLSSEAASMYLNFTCQVPIRFTSVANKGFVFFTCKVRCGA